jgi:hypothetical protein
MESQRIDDHTPDDLAVPTATTLSELRGTLKIWHGAYTRVTDVLVIRDRDDVVSTAKFSSHYRATNQSRPAVFRWETSEDVVGFPGATMVSTIEWPQHWHHPEVSNVAMECLSQITSLPPHALEDLSVYLKYTFFIRPAAGSMKEIFTLLVKEWKRDTVFCSDSTEICMHPAYQRIIGLGAVALPFIFEELQTEPGHWFWALQAITGEDPVAPEYAGKVDVMAEIWMAWFEKQMDPLKVRP